MRTRYRIDTVNSPDDGAHGCPKHVENRNKHTRKKVRVKLVYVQRSGERIDKTDYF